LPIIQFLLGFAVAVGSVVVAHDTFIFPHLIHSTEFYSTKYQHLFIAIIEHVLLRLLQLVVLGVGLIATIATIMQDNIGCIDDWCLAAADNTVATKRLGHSLVILSCFVCFDHLQKKVGFQTHSNINSLMAFTNTCLIVDSTVADATVITIAAVVIVFT
jgi:hypothetical protein